MLKYGDLNLKEIRDKASLDFAHYTYKGNQCSCCYGPKDMARIHWKNGEILEGDYSYILFKNANNGGGIVTKNDYVCEGQESRKQRKKLKPWQVHKPCFGNVYILYGGLSDIQMNIVIEELQKQLGEDYKVNKPENECSCIEIEYIRIE